MDGLVWLRWLYTLTNKLIRAKRSSTTKTQQIKVLKLGYKQVDLINF